MSSMPVVTNHQCKSTREGIPKERERREDNRTDMLGCLANQRARCFQRKVRRPPPSLVVLLTTAPSALYPPAE